MATQSTNPSRESTPPAPPSGKVSEGAETPIVMIPRRVWETVWTVVGTVAGLLTILGGLVTLWGEQDVLSILLYWVGEEWALGTQNVIRDADGRVFLTNPGAMMRWAILIWAVAFSQIGTGVYVLGRTWNVPARWARR